LDPRTRNVNAQERTEKPHDPTNSVNVAFDCGFACRGFDAVTHPDCKPSRSPMAQALITAAIAVVMLLVPQPAVQKLTQSEIADARALVLLVDKVMTGDFVGRDALLGYHGHFLRAPGGRTYVPFTLEIKDGPHGPFRSIAAYLRVAKRGDRITSGKRDVRIGPTGIMGGSASPEGASGALQLLDRPDSPPAGPYPAQDLFFLPLPAAEAGGERLIRRAIALVPGAYDLYVAMREPESSLRLGEAAKKAFLKLELDVPGFSTRALSMSSIIVAQRLIGLDGLLPAGEQARRPYALGRLEIVPAVEATFDRSDKLTVVFIAYNAVADARGKPDVLVEYVFYRTAGDRRLPFGRTESREFRADTLPPEFDLRAGHELLGTRAFPMDTFSPGDYKLEIRVTDRLASATVSRDLAFVVR
jgi:hypothetical protein